MEPAAVVVLVDNDASFRRSTERLIRAAGFNVVSFASGSEFLIQGRPTGAACLVLDLQMPGMSGFDVQRELAASGCRIPTIFLTGSGDVPTTVRAIKRGAVEFLTKPVDDEDLFNALSEALARAREMRLEAEEGREARRNYESLTPSERGVMTRIIDGMLGGQIATDLGIPEAKVEFHRGQLMRKMNATSVPELVRLAMMLGLIVP